ncbi:MAG TPA: hypothetical protein VEX43_03545 [Chthoniobacterales bacterium]|nr:hypothetical protein [Chthoniobacterales bacterium]
MVSSDPLSLLRGWNPCATPQFAEFRNESLGRAVMKRRVEAMREQLGLAAE